LPTPEVTKGRRKLHSKKIHKVYSPNLSTVIKSRMIMWAGNVYTNEIKNGNRSLVEKPEEKNHSEDLGVHKRIILKCILVKQI
jgi:hypothetical protein